jgi:hypothetical protein
VPLVLLSPGNAQDYCLGRIGRDRVCLLQKEVCDVAKYERQKVEVKEPMIHIMNPATKQTTFAAYDNPALAVDLLTDLQYADLIREQHPVAEWNRILLAIKEGNFENKSEFNDIKLRATRKPAFSKSFTPRKKVKFAMGGAIEGVGMLDMGASYEVKATLQPRAMENQAEPWILTGKTLKVPIPFIQEEEKEADDSDGKPPSVKLLLDAEGETIDNPTIKVQPIFNGGKT